MIDRRTMLLGTVAAPMAAAERASCARGVAARGGAETGLIEEIEGWRVRVDASLVAQDADLWSETSRFVECQLYFIARTLPPRAVEALRQIEIHVGGVAADPRAAVGGRVDSDARAAEIAEAPTFLDESHERPWSLLHALALSCYRTRLSGADRAAVASAHAAALTSGKYDRAQGVDGEYRRHPGLAGPADYFAAASTALFGTSDCHPFVRSQLREIDPRGYKLVARLWTRRIRLELVRTPQRPVDFAEPGMNLTPTRSASEEMPGF